MNNKMVKEEKEMEIDLLSLFFFLLDKWKILLLGAVIGAVAQLESHFFRLRCISLHLHSMYYPRQRASLQ